MVSPISDGSKKTSAALSRRGLIPFSWLGVVLLAQVVLAAFLLLWGEWGLSSLISLGLSAVAGGLVLLRAFESRLRRVHRKLEGILSELERARPNTTSHSSEQGVLELIDCIEVHTRSLIAMAIEREKQILKAALQDPVTGLGNRTVLSHRISLAIKSHAESA